MMRDLLEIEFCIHRCMCPVGTRSPSPRKKYKIRVPLREKLRNTQRWMQNSILNKTLIESFYIHCVPFRLLKFEVSTRDAGPLSRVFAFPS